MDAAVRKDIVPVLTTGFVQYVDHMGDDLTVVNAARVSFNKESGWDGEQHWTGRITDRKLPERDEKLISYLAKHKHWTPFAHPQITLRIKAPISIRTQLFKHKQGLVENEVSRRYVTDEPEFYIPDWRAKPTNGAKQGSEDFIDNDALRETFDQLYLESVSKAHGYYNFLIGSGVAPEQARFILPQGAFTEWWWTGSLAAYARVYALRSDPHAQWEVREYANAISTLIEPLFPVSWKALTNQ
jgi:thymidylate synthase (FAD)